MKSSMCRPDPILSYSFVSEDYVRKMSLSSGDHTIDVNKEFMYSEGQRLFGNFHTDNYNNEDHSDLSFWLFRPGSLSVNGSITISICNNVIKLNGFDLNYVWKDSIDANPTAGDAGIMEGHILPVTEGLTGNDFEITIDWKNTSNDSSKSNGKIMDMSLRGDDNED